MVYTEIWGPGVGSLPQTLVSFSRHGGLRIQGFEGHVVSLGIWGSVLAKFVLGLGGPGVGRVCSELQHLCVHTAGWRAGLGVRVVVTVQHGDLEVCCEGLPWTVGSLRTGCVSGLQSCADTVGFGTWAPEGHTAGEGLRGPAPQCLC